MSTVTNRECSCPCGPNCRMPCVRTTSVKAPAAPVEAVVPSDERQAFEAEQIRHVQAYSNGLHLPHLERTGDGYQNPLVHASWQGWQARAALSPPAVLVEPAEQEPVAWRYRYHSGGAWKLATESAPQWAADHSGFEEEPLYAAPAVPLEQPAGQNADEIEHLRSAAQQARTALSSLIASGDRVVYSSALTALDEALKNVHLTELRGKFPDAADEGFANWSAL